MPAHRTTVPDIENFVPDTHRYPFANLEALLPNPDPQTPGRHWRMVLDRSWTTVDAYRRRGLSWQQADELACRVGLHPGLVWDDWFERGLFDGKAAA